MTFTWITAFPAISASVTVSVSSGFVFQRDRNTVSNPGNGGRPSRRVVLNTGRCTHSTHRSKHRMPVSGADDARFDSIRLAFVERAKQGQAVARVFHRLAMSEQQAGLWNVDEVFHSLPSSDASSS